MNMNKATTLKELEFALSVGKAGLAMWKKGPMLEKVRRELARLEAEIKRRKADGERS
jgi:transcription initiation factor IIE alpha subunit